MANTASDGAWVGPPTGSPCPAAGPWNLVDGWLRVEYLNAAGAWVGVTTEWLQLGFARGLLSPTQPVGGGAGSNPVHPNAILIFQQQADRDASGTLTAADNPNNIFEARAPLNTVGIRSIFTIHARASPATQFRRAWPIRLATSTAS